MLRASWREFHRGRLSEVVTKLLYGVRLILSRRKPPEEIDCHRKVSNFRRTRHFVQIYGGRMPYFVGIFSISEATVENAHEPAQQRIVRSTLYLTKRSSFWMRNVAWVNRQGGQHATIGPRGFWSRRQSKRHPPPHLIKLLRTLLAKNAQEEDEGKLQ